jgi:hypothetical protein
MKLPRVRLTLRRMMIAVALAAIGCWIVADIERRSHFRRLAEYHSSKMYPDIACNAGGLYIEGEGIVSQDRVLWHRALHDKYERAVRRPWLSVEPDLPAPK